jgi:hypothetical protein
MPIRPKTLTLNKLVEELEQLQNEGFGECEVYFGDDYGDTCQALPVASISTPTIKETASSKSGLAIKEVDPEKNDTFLHTKTIVAMRS